MFGLLFIVLEGELVFYVRVLSYVLFLFIGGGIVVFVVVRFIRVRDFGVRVRDILFMFKVYIGLFGMKGIVCKYLVSVNILIFVF